MPYTSIKPVNRKNDIVIQKIDGEVLIYDLVLNKAFCLNHSAAVVWENCDGVSSIADLKKIAGEKLNAKLTADFVSLALKQLAENGLVENDPKYSEIFGRISRREIVKGIGLTSTVALPLIGSIVAPRTIDAQSSVCVTVLSGCQCNPGYMSGDDCTGGTQAGMACANPLCRCIAGPGLDDCMP